MYKLELARQPKKKLPPYPARKTRHGPHCMHHPVRQPPTDHPMETMCFPAVEEAAAQPARMLRRASPCHTSQQQTFGQGPVQCFSSSISVTAGTRRNGLPGSCSRQVHSPQDAGRSMQRIVLQQAQQSALPSLLQQRLHSLQHVRHQELHESVRRVHLVLDTWNRRTILSKVCWLCTETHVQALRS